MREKIVGFFKSEKVKNTTKKIFNKKTILTAGIIILVVAGLKIGYSYMFEVKGVVSKIDGTKVTLVTRLNTQTVDVANSAVDATKIVVGEKIEIVKNLSGQVIYAKSENFRENHVRFQNKEGHFNKKQNMKGVKGNKQLKNTTKDATQSN